MEEFVAQVYADGRITLPRQLRKRFEIKDGDYVRLFLTEVLGKNNNGEWISRKMGIG